MKDCRFRCQQRVKYTWTEQISLDNVEPGVSIGLPATLVLAAVGELLAAAWLLASPLRTLREMPAASG